MARILNNNFFNLQNQREYFPRTTAFYQSDHIAAKISKIAFPIFVAGFLVLAARDSFDIAIRKVHYKKPSKAQEIKEKSIQLLSKYGPAILAIGALGCASYFAYNFLNTKTIESVAKDVIPDVNDNLAQVLSNANNQVEPTCSLFEHALKHPQNVPTNTIVNPVNNDPLRQVLENQVSGPTCNPFESALQYPQDVLPPHAAVNTVNSGPLGQVLEPTCRANPFQNITKSVADIISKNSTITQNIADHAPESTSTVLAIIGSLISIPLMTVGCSVAAGLLRDRRPEIIEDHAVLPQSQEVDHNIAGNQHPVEQALPQAQEEDQGIVESKSSDSATDSIESASSESSSDVVGGGLVIGVHERSPPPSPKPDGATQIVERFPPEEEGVDEDDMKDGEPSQGAAASAAPISDLSGQDKADNFDVSKAQFHQANTPNEKRRQVQSCGSNALAFLNKIFQVKRMLTPDELNKILEEGRLADIDYRAKSPGVPIETNIGVEFLDLHSFHQNKRTKTFSSIDFETNGKKSFAIVPIFAIETDRKSSRMDFSKLENMIEYGSGALIYKGGKTYAIYRDSGFFYFFDSHETEKYGEAYLIKNADVNKILRSVKYLSFIPDDAKDNGVHSQVQFYKILPTNS